ncbi:MAG: translation initiation factor IF-3 [Patescibacteria group bacterium]
MRRKWRKAKPKLKKLFRSNEQIRTPEVFLIDALGENVGVIPTRKAIEMAKEANMDLVEVNPTARPPVVKIIDLGQFKYDKEKKAHKQRQQQKKVETKGIRLSVRISRHDFDFRLNQAKKFLEKGNKLKIELILKGREKQHPVKARETIDEFVQQLEQSDNFEIIREQDLTKQGGKFTIILLNKKS